MKKLSAIIAIATASFCGFSAPQKTDVPETTVFHNALEKPFSLTGFYWRKGDESLCRIPHSVGAEDISKKVHHLARHTAGGMVRFKTNSKYIVIKAQLSGVHTPGHMALTGVAGFDLFENLKDGKTKYVLTTVPEKDDIGGKTPMQRIAWVHGKEMRSYTIYMPSYAGVKSLEIGIEQKASIEAPDAQKIAKPIVFYGSSITQGASAARPSNTYNAMLCRELDAPQINLGFAGSAKGEIAMAKLIGEIDAALFIYDYDHNAPSTEHLKNTHEAFFKEIRKARPDMPIIILPRVYLPNAERTAIIKQTYLNAVANGDKKVWYVDGGLHGDVDSSYLVNDGTHPNDLCFYMMFKRILPVAKEALGVK